MTIPLEFTVVGKPSSVNGTSLKKAAWKSKVRAEALAALSPWTGPPHTADVTVKIFFFPSSSVYLDVDNGLKHTIDGFNPPLLKNDKTVMRVITERVLPSAGASLLVTPGVAATLINAMRMASGGLAPGIPAEHVTVVKVEPYTVHAGLW